MGEQMMEQKKYSDYLQILKEELVEEEPGLFEII